MAGVFRAGAWLVDPSRSQAVQGDRVVHLRPKVMDLLAVLADHPGEVISKQALLDTIWGTEFVSESALTTAIAELRHALVDGEQVEVIETVPKRGYRLALPIERSFDRHPPADAPVTATRPADAVAGPQSDRIAPVFSRVVGDAVLDTPSTAGTTWTRLTHRCRVASRWLSTHWPLLAAALALALALGERLVSRFSPAAHVDSIAVLPFTDQSAAGDAEWLAESLTEGLIRQLGQIGRFEKVINRPSVARYESAAAAPGDVARALAVDAVITGSVRRDAEHVRVAVTLVDGRSERTLWSGAYERDLSDGLTIQVEIVDDIAIQVGATVDESLRRRFQARARVNPGAQQAYLRGLALANRYGPSDLEGAVRQFDEAIARAPAFAPAHAARALVYFHLLFRGAPTAEALAEGRRSADRALALDPGLADAHSASGSFAWVARDWSKAESSHRRAVELNPNSMLARIGFAHFLIVRGRYEEGVAQALRAVELDPADRIAIGHLAWAYYHARRHGESASTWRTALELMPEPRDPVAEGLFALSLVLSDRPDEALRLCANGAAPAHCVCVNVIAGRRSNAVALARTLPGGGADNPEVQACLGHADGAIQLLEDAYAAPDGPLLLLFIRGPTMYEFLVPDERFRHLLQRLELPE